MATVSNPRPTQNLTRPRTLSQKTCIGMGIGFVAIGLIGIIIPGFIGMHLSLPHDIIHLASGMLAIWVGYADDPNRAFNFSIGFGALYGLLGISGFILGSEGYPGVGHMEADGNLLRIIPNVLEFGTNDHIVHILISAVLLSTGYLWKRNELAAGRAVVETQAGRRTFESYKSPILDVPTNSSTDLKDADLGHSDISRKSDYLNRTHDPNNERHI